MLGRSPTSRRRAAPSSSARTSAIVPPGFREVDAAMEIQSYRVFFFEKRDDFFLPPRRLPARGARLHHHARPAHARRLVERPRHRRPRATSACSAQRRTKRCRDERAHERRRLLGLLADHGLLPDGLDGAVMRGEAEAPPELPEIAGGRAAPASSRARPSRLFGVADRGPDRRVEQVNCPAPSTSTRTGGASSPLRRSSSSAASRCSARSAAALARGAARGDA